MEQRLLRAPIVPLVQCDDPDVAIDISQALLKGGLTVVEVVLRAKRALQCLDAIGKACPGALIGAGTVLTGEQARAAIDAGARFIVSPGLDESVITAANAHHVPVFPGVATASEAQRAWNLGLRLVKVFPAGIAGGPALLKALSSVFRAMKFMPTGGVSAKNLAQYLAIPSVFACGGSWLTPADAVAAGDFEMISKLANEAVKIARASRGD
ncbi:MAG: bifunctional 4-hydroxy-2-oxoglutarate aldolase/2-dehydro-3-deoxy-phosphogluconate aldolase [Proteobacteria bacterium]|nr:bifunctional 4-hydroxy-2-oxoglutarate aldolase/2-dehydro-3-deoxy-phosphogluconate aldolase [Pseudomonadota bacterium]